MINKEYNNIPEWKKKLTRKIGLFGNEMWYVCVNNYAGFIKGRLYKADKQGKIYDGNGDGVCPGEALARLADFNEIETWKRINHIK